LTEIAELKPLQGRPTLTIIGLKGEPDESLHSFQSVRRISPNGKIVAIGKRLGRIEFNEILKGGANAVVFDVGSSEALLKVFDLAFLGQHVVILDPWSGSIASLENAQTLIVAGPPRSRQRSQREKLN
jgi:hypothetical protein